MRVGVAGSVKHVLEPWPAGDTVGVQPVPLDLHHRQIDGASLRLGKRASRQFSRERLIKPGAGVAKLLDAIEQRIEIELIQIFAPSQITNKVANIICVVGKVEGKKIGIREPESKHAP